MDYIVNFVYENGELQMIYHPEGVIRPTPDNASNETAFVYDYFIKDYLGNVRVVLTEEDASLTQKWLATMEEVYAHIEEVEFDNLEDTRDDLPAGYPLDASVEFNEHIAYLIAEDELKIGPAILMGVNKDDRIQGSVSYFYTEDAPGASYNHLGTFVQEVLISLVSAATASTNLQESTLLNTVNGTNHIGPQLTQFLAANMDTTDMSRPHGYLVYLLYDNQFNLVTENSGALRVENPNDLHQLLTQELIIEHDGFLHVYVSNGSSEKGINFDNFLISAAKGKTRQINHYYPYGLRISGMDGYTHDYKNMYTSKELQTGEFQSTASTGLEMYDFHARFYDPQLGRWFAPDPAEQFSNPYLAMGNNPVVYVDPDGEFIIEALVIAGLLFTETGYELQKMVSPVAVHIDLKLGTHQKGLGFDVSFGVPKVLPLSYRAHYGRTYYWETYGGRSGWETRRGAEWSLNGYMFGIPLSVTYSGTTFSGVGYPREQTTNTLTVGNPFINAAYQNDTEFFSLPGVPTYDGGDAYRTAAARLKVGPFQLGMILHTGEEDSNTPNEWRTDYRGRLANTMTGGSIDNPNERNGILYFGFGPFRVGRDSERIRHAFQNRFAHDFIAGGQNGSAYPWILPLPLKPRWYFQFGWGNGYSFY